MIAFKRSRAGSNSAWRGKEVGDIGWLGAGSGSLGLSGSSGADIDRKPSFIELQLFQIQKQLQTIRFVTDEAADQSVAGLQQSIEGVEDIQRARGAVGAPFGQQEAFAGAFQLAGGGEQCEPSD